MSIPQTIVHVIKSEADPTRYYTGLTSNLAGRLNAHNAGRVPHTSDGKPWIVDVILEFSDERRAVAFEVSPHCVAFASAIAFKRRHGRVLREIASSGNGKERKQRGGHKIAGIYLEQVM